MKWERRRLAVTAEDWRSLLAEGSSRVERLAVATSTDELPRNDACVQACCRSCCSSPSGRQSRRRMRPPTIASAGTPCGRVRLPSRPRSKRCRSVTRRSRAGICRYSSRRANACNGRLRNGDTHPSEAWSRTHADHLSDGGQYERAECVSRVAGGSFGILAGTRVEVAVEIRCPARFVAVEK